MKKTTRKSVLLHPDDYREIEHITIGGEVVDVVVDRYGVTTKGEMIVAGPSPSLEFCPVRYLGLSIPPPPKYIIARGGL